jgi:eukaryotic-like serine/threonine-protein kinase
MRTTGSRTTRRQAVAQRGEAGSGTEIVLSTRWTLGSPIAQGGFGWVFEASAEHRPQAVVKLVRKLPGAQRELLFDLPKAHNILPVIDRGEWGDYWVLVMPRADESLRAFEDRRKGTFDPEEAVTILQDIAAGLAQMEGRVVHRDLKPENVLRWEGRWCLADFGIARYAEATTEPDTRKFSLSAPYAAPEQWKFLKATSATDIYAFGVVAFELLEGQRPFPGPSVEDFRSQHLQGLPPEVKHGRAALRGLISECLLKEASARPTVANVLHRLGRLGEPLPRGLAQLHEANAQQIARVNAEQVARSFQEEEERRRAGLFQAACGVLAGITREIEEKIREITSLATIDTKDGLRVGFGQAQLAVAPMKRSFALDLGLCPKGLDVVCCSSISVMYVHSPSQAAGTWQGRTHSLWYCDMLSKGTYRLVELAFMNGSSVPQIPLVEPFGLDPSDRHAAEALGPVSGICYVAWQPEAVDQGEDGEFVDRWLGWLAEGCNGTLRRPTLLPENRPKRQ